MDVNELRKFIIESGKVDYSSGDESSREKQVDGSITISYQSGDWRFRDNYFGGEPYAGQTVIWYQDKVVWTFVYYGWVEQGVEDLKQVYTFLQAALRKSPEDLPIRGPKEFDQANYKYINGIQGDLENFAGQELIFDNGKEIYKARYMGGWVDNREE